MKISESLFFIIDIAVIAVYLLCMISAYKKGFIYELVTLVWLLISLAVSYLLAPVAAAKYPITTLSDAGYTAQLLEPYIDRVLYFVIIFILMRIIYLVLSPLFKSISKIPFLGFFNRILGMVMGFFNATLTITIVSSLLLLPIFDNGIAARNKTLVKQVNMLTDTAVEYIFENVDVEKITNVFENPDSENIGESFWEWFGSLGE